MRLLLTFLLSFLTFKAICQKSLCEENSVLYSVCYQLDPYGKFTYDYTHCTGTVLGKGSYTIGAKAITFSFDSVTSPIIQITNSQLPKGQIKISYLHLSKGYPFEHAPIYYQDKAFRTDSLGVVTLDYSGGPIKIYQFFGERDSILIHPDRDNKNSYEILWHTTGDTFMPKGRKIELVKRGGKYKFREKVLGYNAEKDKYFPKWQTTYYIEPRK